MRTELDPAEQPFLDHHRIDDTPVLPGVMGVEAFVEAALALAPGWHLVAVEDVDFLAPFKFYRDESRVIEVQARLVPDRRRAGGRLSPARASHALRPGRAGDRALHRPGSARPTAPRTCLPSRAGRPRRRRQRWAPDDIYRIYFHGPAYQVLGAAWGEDGARVRSIGRRARARPATCRRAPRHRAPSPRAVLPDGRRARTGHDRRDGAAHACRPGDDRTGSHRGRRASTAMVIPRDDGSFDAQVVGPGGDGWLCLEGYRTTPLPGSPGEDLLAPLRAGTAGLTAATMAATAVRRPPARRKAHRSRGEAAATARRREPG